MRVPPSFSFWCGFSLTRMLVYRSRSGKRLPRTSRRFKRAAEKNLNLPWRGLLDGAINHSPLRITHCVIDVCLDYGLNFSRVKVCQGRSWCSTPSLCLPPPHALTPTMPCELDQSVSVYGRNDRRAPLWPRVRARSARVTAAGVPTPPRVHDRAYTHLGLTAGTELTGARFARCCSYSQDDPHYRRCWLHRCVPRLVASQKGVDD